MTLRADLAALLADSGIVDVDIDQAVDDEHVRTSAYLKVLAVVAAAPCRDHDRAVVSVILRDPHELVSKTAVVELVDRIAMKAGDSAEFMEWAAGIAPEIDRFTGEGHRVFLRRRIHDWAIYLTVMAGRTPVAEQMAAVTDWMQRRIASEATSPPVLAMLTEAGSTRKIRNIARHRALSVATSAARPRGRRTR